MTDTDRLTLIRSLIPHPQITVVDYQDDDGSFNPAYYLLVFNGIESGIGTVFGNVSYYQDDTHHFKAYLGYHPTAHLIELVDRHLASFIKSGYGQSTP